MGQRASLTSCVVRGKEREGDGQGLVANLRRAEALIAAPEKLEHECDFHFGRAGLDANGDLRRVELRRLLWTFAHGLGSTELTWEAIEATAVVGTIEPHVPVVTRSEFFRCVLKTVHLVAAELHRKVEEEAARRLLLEEHMMASSMAGSRSGSTNPWAALAERHGRSGASSSSSRSPSLASASSGTTNADHEDEEEVEAQTEAPSKGKGKGKRAEGARPRPEPVTTPLFLPAPGGSQHEVAPVNGMTAMVLSNEGTFDPQRLFVGGGMMELNDPAQPAAGGNSAFDLALLEYAATGDEISSLPVAPLLPAFAVRGKALDRMLVLGFAGDDALCLWFATLEDCELCRNVLASEGAEARRYA